MVVFAWYSSANCLDRVGVLGGLWRCGGVMCHVTGDSKQHISGAIAISFHGYYNKSTAA